MSHVVLWLVVAGVMAVIEAFSFGLITMWFVVGALVAFVADLLGASFVVQIVLFLVVSVLCLVLLRPVFVKYRNRGHSAEPSLLGERGVVCEVIDNDGLTGRIELSNHMTWSARSATGEVLPEGTRVEVVAQESIKLIVRPCEPQA
ncbi:NfeD family protein [uncultured Ellagibacter sp.]|uniref:NfeD family protein n=1 Tax=uncultured Ellagibacter sp. TaxID=2137580 RepID=UPI00262B200B|nr:NfeD family protein [uncultured Ellagibacter sp.]